MASKEVITSDFNDNDVVFYEPLTALGAKNYEEDVLFPELDDLCTNPNKFLTPNVNFVGPNELMEFQDSNDLELIKYMDGGDAEFDDAVDYCATEQTVSAITPKLQKRKSVDGVNVKETINEGFDGQSHKVTVNGKSGNSSSFKTIRIEPTQPSCLKQGIVIGQLARNQLIQSIDPSIIPIHSRGKTTFVKRKSFGSYCSAESTSPTPSDDCPNKSKSALAAKENRIKKKKFVSELEKTVKSLTIENQKLDTEVGCMRKQIKSLQTEVKYLSNVITNESALSSVLKKVCSTPGVRFVGGGLVTPYDDEDHMAVHADYTPHVDPKLKKRCLVDLRKCDDFDENINCCENKSATMSPACAYGTHMNLKRIREIDHDYASESKDEGQHLVKPDIVSVPTNTCGVKKSADAPKAEITSKCFKNRRHSDSVPSRVESISEKSPHKKTPDAGVCLHVSKDTVSVEFCSNCNSSSKSRQK